MKIKIILTAILLCACINEEIQSNIIGTYRMSAGGGTGFILSLNEDNSLEYLSWSDIGGYFEGFSGNYQYKNNKLFISYYIPINEDTHAIRKDALSIRNLNNEIFLVPAISLKEFDNSIKDSVNITKWIYKDKNTGRPVKGINIYVKTYQRNISQLDNFNIIWHKLSNEESVAIEFPPALHRPIIDQ